MNVKLRLLSVGVLFFTGQALMAQKKKSDTTTKTKEIDLFSQSLFNVLYVLVSQSKVNVRPMVHGVASGPFPVSKNLVL